MSSRDVNKAIVAALPLADATLAALGVTGVYDTEGPESKVLPLIIFEKQNGEHVYTLPKRAWQVHTFIIKGIAAEVKDIAEQIDNRIYALLNRQVLPLDNGYMMLLQRDLDVNYRERNGGKTFYHVGGIYQVMVGDV